MVTGPKYNGKYLQSLLRRHLGDTKLDGALTSVVIPAFDITHLQPTIFSSYHQLKNQPAKNALLSDIAIGTSAAPTFFPAHYFETEDGKGGTRAFNLIDGGVAANNPTLCAMSHVAEDIIVAGNGDLLGKSYMVISIGCGTSSNPKGKYSAKDTAQWGILDWILKGSTVPILDMFNAASGDMVDIHLSILSAALGSSHQYLRIQVPTHLPIIPKKENITMSGLLW
ncbi:patatin-like protein 2 [Triticum aestivum]|uniref:Patatin n=1 Tax=Triticum turgidum subsp. durum TaxID=4567 RepID=A0A9R0SKM5_TRITD|nr:patatin-like protein 2 [Triticum aestivum]XP_044360915.1 patatin-like protein 2 [Triticum aestivum]VAH97079.1 unnamed protein product [Triticum turgidum subsp. durum]